MTPASTFEDSYFTARLSDNPFLGIFRGKSLEQTLELCGAAWDSGVQLVEIPVQTPASFEILAAAVEAGRARGRDVGAGTVLTREQVQEAAKLGATFCVSPGFDAAITGACRDVGLAHLPGVATATEITAATGLGLVWLKAFPASVLGPEWIRAMHGPFPEVKFVCTGGMSTESADAYMKAGASGIAIGSGWTV